MSFVTPPSSPRVSNALKMGSPIKRSLFFDDNETTPVVDYSPPKIRKVETKRYPWMDEIKQLLSPEVPQLPFSPIEKQIKKGDYCEVSFLESPIGQIVKRSFVIGKTSKKSPNQTQEGLAFVHPTDFQSQMKALKQNYPHCLSPIAVCGTEEENNTFKVSQYFPAGIPLDDYIKENPSKVEELSQKWINAITQTIQESGQLVVDPKPANAVIFENNGSLEVKLIDLDLVAEEDVDDFGDIISGRYFVSEECDGQDSYSSALQLGLLDMRTGFKLGKKELHQKFLDV